MPRLANRLIRLERRHADLLHPRCPECGDRGRLVVSTIDEFDPIPNPSGCGTCGEIQHMIIRYVQKPITHWAHHAASVAAIETA